MKTHEGRVAASRASLSLLLVLPVDDKRRCLGVKLVPGTTKTVSTVLHCNTFHIVIPCEGGTAVSADWGIDIGETLAAATESESRLRFE